MLNSLREALKRTGPGKWFKRRRFTRRVRQAMSQDRSMLQFYSGLIQPNDICFDIGANYGLRTNVLSRVCSKVVAVEPQSACMEFLHAAFSKNPNVHLVHAAVGAQPGSAEIMISDAELLSSLSHDWLARVKESGRFQGASWSKSETVRVTTLDTLIAEFGYPAYVKIDVEGFERDVLRGLSSAVPLISFEFTPECLGAAFECLDIVGNLGHYVANYSPGETMLFSFDHWLSPEELEPHLESMRDDITKFGDVFVRLCDQAKQPLSLNR